MRTRIKKALAAAATVVTATTAVVAGMNGGGASAAATSLMAYGIAGNGTLMLQFWTATPEQNDWVRRITGLTGDTAVIGVDFRVQDGKLYAVGNKGGIYTIGIPSAIASKVSQLQVPLYGTNFGVDFNPAADRLRVISDNAQNLRHNLNDHTTLEDTTLTTPPATGPARGVTAAAYTNNDLNAATGTTLFDINTTTDQVVIQSPANNGLLVATGGLGFDADGNAGFDIFSDLTGGRTATLTAFATLTPVVPDDQPKLQNFYGVDLLTGTTNLIGTFPLDVTDVAVALDR
ncbi:hypothetical protein Ait01nite_097950 [Actinoplanes italicus]|uniref:Uncharacterized protein DUF4394 n=1 Tax=Actinoplanes italicus TaxID=113567 RepID=A0A2T0K3U9_9ACTN|nr:DUF4394 domain-containing protein [Actinoplanes italicus]PRX17357.1 uncharacterized protein DUF4394 [Actinoplanes italicus]GIE36750.1 hypothetical protein Ait01nite_097950 [Actinoplanes italicus]